VDDGELLNPHRGRPTSTDKLNGDSLVRATRAHDAEVTGNNIADAEGARNAQVISIGEIL